MTNPVQTIPELPFVKTPHIGVEVWCIHPGAPGGGFDLGWWGRGHDHGFASAAFRVIWMRDHLWNAVRLS